MLCWTYELWSECHRRAHGNHSQGHLFCVRSEDTLLGSGCLPTPGSRAPLGFLRFQLLLFTRPPGGLPTHMGVGEGPSVHADLGAHPRCGSHPPGPAPALCPSTSVLQGHCFPPPSTTQTGRKSYQLATLTLGVPGFPRTDSFSILAALVAV